MGVHRHNSASERTASPQRGSDWRVFLPAPVASCALGSSDGANDPGYGRARAIGISLIIRSVLPPRRLVVKHIKALRGRGCSISSGRVGSASLIPVADAVRGRVHHGYVDAAGSLQRRGMAGLRPVSRPLGGLPLEQLMLLHRHWIWANRQRELFEAELVAGRPPRLDNMAANAMSAMFLWYALSVVGDRGRR